MEEVVEDEVASHGACRIYAFYIAREEVGDVSSLKNKKDEPVDASDDVVHSESRVVRIVLPPDSPAEPNAIVRLVERVIERNDDR